MAKVDIYSGFLGAGKTTLIKKLIKEAYANQKVVLIENEFGEIGIDGGFMKEAGVEITEMNSGCICCSLVGDFSEALKKVVSDFNPDRIIIEPSGVGKLSDIIKAVQNTEDESLVINALTTVVDANKCKMHMKNFGEFYADQIANATCIVLSHTKNASGDKIQTAVDIIKEHNNDTVIVTTDWDELSGEQLMNAIENKDSIKAFLESLEHDELDECPVCSEHHHHHDEECHCHEHHEHHHHDEECHCHEHHEHHHHHDEECHCHEHHEHHHHHDEECHCHEHHEHHHHDEECHCHEHHEHHHHHHADDVFTSWGRESARIYTKEEIENILKSFDDSDKYGMILRAKGIVCAEGEWIYFDYIPSEIDIRYGAPDITGKICVIGSKINEDALCELFRL